MKVIFESYIFLDKSKCVYLAKPGFLTSSQG